MANIEILFTKIPFEENIDNIINDPFLIIENNF